MKTLKLLGIAGMATALMSILAMFAFTAQTPDAVITVEAISPQEIKDNGWSTPPYYPSSGLKNVGRGELVYLLGAEASGEDVSAFAWSIMSAPAGSQAALDSTDKARTTFTPDTTGKFDIQLSITTSSGTADTTVTINSANYVGVGTIGGLVPDFAKGQCAPCHTTNEAGWKLTRHASKFQRDIDGATSRSGSSYQQSCLGCHTLGYKTAPTANNGGFDDLERELGWTLNDTLQPGNFDSLVTNFPSLAHLTNIQCEHCHGPGSTHKGVAANIEVSLDEGVCGQCHESEPYHLKNIQWKNSRHAVGVAFASTRTPCKDCHSGYGFINRIDAVKDKGPLDQTSGFPQISCAVCHDPHVFDFVSNPEQLRKVEDVTLANDEVVSFGGRGRFCMSCHLSRHDAESYVAEFAVGERFRGPHGSIQTDMLAATNAVTFGKQIPSGSHRTAVADLCIDCHMAPTPATGEPGHNRIGDHSFAMHDPVDNVDNVSACQPCHVISSFDEFESDFDYDSDGNVETMRAEIQGLLDALGMLLPPVGDPSVVVDTTQFPASVYTPVVLGAAYNHAFAVGDGSGGMHNFAFAANLLKASIDTLSMVTSVELPGVATIPEDYALRQNYPNPFNPATTITYSLTEGGHVLLKVYNLLGQEVASLVDEQRRAGTHKVSFTASTLSSGVYVYRLSVNGFTAMKKMAFVK